MQNRKKKKTQKIHIVIFGIHVALLALSNMLCGLHRALWYNVCQTNRLNVTIAHEIVIVATGVPQTRNIIKLHSKTYAKVNIKTQEDKSNTYLV